MEHHIKIKPHPLDYMMKEKKKEKEKERIPMSEKTRPTPEKIKPKPEEMRPTRWPAQTHREGRNADPIRPWICVSSFSAVASTHGSGHYFLIFFSL
jgi:hypothetical protein